MGSPTFLRGHLIYVFIFVGGGATAFYRRVSHDRATVSVFTENASVHGEAAEWRRFAPTGGIFFILSKVAAFGQRGFTRCSA